jgi:threonine synthase
MREAGDIGSDEVVVAPLTASGLKDPDVTQEYLADIPAIEPNVDALMQTLESVYGFRPSRRNA